MRFKTREGKWMESNHPLMESVIELQMLNKKSEKRMQQVLDEIDIDKLNKSIMDNINQILEKWGDKPC